MAQREDGNRETLATIDLNGHATPLQINHTTERFEIEVDGRLAFLLFHQKGTTLSLIHTEVPAALEGKGLAGTLARTALDYARNHAMSVKPFCPFVAAWLRRHPEYQSLVDPEFSTPHASGSDA